MSTTYHPHRMRPAIFSLVFLTMSLHAEEPQADWPDFSDPRFDPARVLDPDSFPATPWAAALRTGDKQKAAELFVRELRDGEPRIDIGHSIPLIRQRWFNQRINENAGMRFDPDDVVNLRFQGVYGIVHQFENEIDWTYDGSQGRTPEWTWHLNRHLHWLNLADAYQESGDVRYPAAWERELRNWIAQAPRPTGRGRGHGSPWRSLDTGIRAGSTWPYAFEIFRRSPHISDAALWLFYCAQRENAFHLLEHPAGGNWLVMETNGLGQAGLFLRETRESSKFIQTALARMKQEIDSQFFPDGTHQEFAPHYAAAGCLANFYVLAKQAEFSGYKVSPEIWDSLAHIALALARIACPDGIVPAVHNSRPFSMEGAYQDFLRPYDPERFEEPPWLSGKSDLLAYGGYAVFRRPDRFSIFDAGPRGTAHFHDDDLQLITWAYGSHFGVDPGSPLYTVEPISRHLRTSAAHNVVQMDGKLHRPAIEIARPTEPVPLSFHGEGSLQGAAARRILLTSNQETFEHERTVLEIDELGWLVLDRLFPPDDSPRSWEWIWTLLVDRVETTEIMDAVACHRSGPIMRIAARGSLTGQFIVSEGLDEPLRGWINLPGTDEYTPMPVLRLLSEEIRGDIWLVTVKAPFPSKDQSLPVQITKTTEQNGTWNISILRGPDRFRITIEGDTDQLRRAQVSKNEDGTDEIFFSNSHTLRQTP